MGLAELGGKEDSNTQPSPPQAARRGQVGGTYLRSKESNAMITVHDRATQKVLEGADRQTNRQTFCALQ